MNEDVLPTVPEVKTLIRFIRDQRVMLDRDLARLYGVSTKALKQAGRRNPGRLRVSATYARGCNLEVTICDLKFPQWTT